MSILPDYSSTIRREIEARVVAMLPRVKSYSPDGGWTPCGARTVTPEWVELGYLVNTHRGQAIFQPGELIAGLPFRVNRTDATQSITVGAGKVVFEREREEEYKDYVGSDDEPVTRYRMRRERDTFDIRITEPYF